MSHKDASIVFVKAETLRVHPQAFQDYINQYFELKNIGGVEYYFAFLVLSLSNLSYQAPKGVARGHGCDIDLFKAGLPDNQRLSDWIYTKLKDPEQKDIIRISKDWDDGCIGSYRED